MLEKLNQDFLQDLSLYIDDMRILKNIYNEFFVYYYRVNNIELDCNKMLALIVYKNVFPRDFGELQLQRGFVYTVFSKKPEFIENEIESLENKLQEIQIQINYIHNEPLESPKELQKEKDIQRAHFIHLQETQQKKNELQKIDDEFNKREIAIKNKNENKLPDLENEVARLKIKLIRTKNMPLHKVINNKNRDQIFAVLSGKHYLDTKRSYCKVGSFLKVEYSIS